MISYKIDNIVFEVPTGWHKMPFEDYVAIQESDNITDHIKSITKLGEEIVLEYHDQLVFLMEKILFIWEQPTFESESIFNSIELGEYYVLPKNIESESIGQFIDLERCLMENKDKLYRAYPQVIATYLCKAIHGKYDFGLIDKICQQVNRVDTTQVITIAMTFIKEYGRIKDKYNESLKSTRVSMDEEMAGVSDFLDKWGFYAAMHHLCSGDILKFDSFCEQPVDKVYTLLTFLKDKADYEHELTEILKHKHGKH